MGQIRREGCPSHVTIAGIGKHVSQGEKNEQKRAGGYKKRTKLKSTLWRMTMLNQVNLIGVLKTDPQERGAAISFRMVTWRTHYDGRRFNTTHTVEVFGKNKEAASQLREGDMVIVQGSVKHSSYEKNGQKVFFTSIIAFSVATLDGKQDGAQAAPANNGAGHSGGSAPQQYPPSSATGDAKPEGGAYSGYNDEYGF